MTEPLDDFVVGDLVAHESNESRVGIITGLCPSPIWVRVKTEDGIKRIWLKDHIRKVGTTLKISEIIIEMEPPAPTPLALVPAINSERLAPDDIPIDMRTFRRWADAACCEWPGTMQAQAYKAWEDIVVFNSSLSMEQFRITYAAWWALSEDMKDDKSPHDNRIVRAKARKKAMAVIFDKWLS